MKNKGWMIVVILLLPSLIWVLLDVSLIHSRKLPYFGPKKLASDGKDTIYYSVPYSTFFNNRLEPIIIDTSTYKVCVMVFIKPEYVKEQFRIAPFLSMVHYEPDKIKHIPIFLVYPFQAADKIFHLKDSLRLTLSNIQDVYLPDSIFHKIRMQYFIQKPYYVYDSFAVLLDKKRNIRGYYDWRYADELKRTIQEFNHLLIKEGYKETLQKNKIEQR